MTRIVMAPMSTAYARVPRALRDRIQQGITLRHDQIERMADRGEWPGGIKGALLTRRIPRADVLFLDWENQSLGKDHFYRLVSTLARRGALKEDTIAHIDHADPDGHAYFPPAVPLHLDIRGRGAGTPRQDDDRPWTIDVITDYVHDRITRACAYTGLDAIWAFCGVKYTDPTGVAPDSVPRTIQISLWLALVRAARFHPRCLGLLLFGHGGELRSYLSAHADAIRRDLR